MPKRFGFFIFALTLTFLLWTDIAQYAVASQEPIRIGLTAVIVEDFLQVNRHLLNYVGEKIGMPVELVLRKSYQEMNDMLEKGEVDAAFVCSVPYILGRDKFGLELLAVPQINGEPLYYSYVVVPIDSETKRFEDLRGKVYAFSDPLSNSGKLVPTYFLAKMGETPETFFKGYIYTQSHYNSIEAVAVGLVDGASVDSYVWDLADATDPKFTKKTKIIEKFIPFPFTPFVIRKEIDPALKERIRGAFLNMHSDAKGKEILNKLRIDKFVKAPDSFYSPVRKMMNFVKNSKIQEAKKPARPKAG
ncbi:MAG: phosphate/phosphite/phosphonate ABC transporter substrate-binding protein, partial [Nitrospirota bacterium]